MYNRLFDVSVFEKLLRKIEKIYFYAKIDENF